MKAENETFMPTDGTGILPDTVAGYISMLEKSAAEKQRLLDSGYFSSISHLHPPAHTEGIISAINQIIKHLRSYQHSGKI